MHHALHHGTQARRANILLTLCPQPVGSPMRLFHLQEASDHVLQSPTRSLATRTSCNKDTFESDPTVLTFKVDSTSKGEILQAGVHLYFYGGLVHWMNRFECAGFLIMPKRPYDIHMERLTMRCLAWDLETLIFRCSFIFAIPICPDPAVSCVVSKHNKEDLSANMIKKVCRDDGNAHDRASLYQGKPF